MRNRPELAVAAVLAALSALLLAACGGDASDVEDGAAAATTTPAPTATPTPGARATAVEATSEIVTRVDGLTGAPVPALSLDSAGFDEERLRANAGSFPPLNDAPVVTAREASWMSAETLVLGAVQNGEARAYPLFMMQFHHVANDVIGGEPYLVTF